jgi:hypothetical protein
MAEDTADSGKRWLDGQRNYDSGIIEDHQNTSEEEEKGEIEQVMRVRKAAAPKTLPFTAYSASQLLALRGGPVVLSNPLHQFRNANPETFG